MQTDDDGEERPSRTSPIIIIEQIPWNQHSLFHRNQE